MAEIVDAAVIMFILADAVRGAWVEIIRRSDIPARRTDGL